MTTQAKTTQVAIFAGGCFWCEEQVFDGLSGVLSVQSGYTGGHKENPTYEQVCAGNTGHLEAVKITFDPSVITYDELLYQFWYNVDPFDPLGQFCDQGESYKAVIFYSDVEQKQKAEESKKKLEADFNQTILTEIRPASAFYPAEDYHQQYSEKNPLRYGLYRRSCGRDARLDEIWGSKKK